MVYNLYIQFFIETHLYKFKKQKGIHTRKVWQFNKGAFRQQISKTYHSKS
jgi:hypothetical protein